MATAAEVAAVLGRLAMGCRNAPEITPERVLVWAEQFADTPGDVLLAASKQWLGGTDPWFPGIPDIVKLARPMVLELPAPKRRVLGYRGRNGRWELYLGEGV